MIDAEAKSPDDEKCGMCGDLLRRPVVVLHCGHYYHLGCTNTELMKSGPRGAVCKVCGEKMTVEIDDGTNVRLTEHDHKRKVNYGIYNGKTFGWLYQNLSWYVEWNLKKKDP